MRPLPSPSEYGSWDQLPTFPAEDEFDPDNPDVQDRLERRARLVEEWRGFVNYPSEAWADADQAAAWRNWFLRRAWEGISFINGNLRRRSPP